MATPGHTFHHFAYAVSYAGEFAGVCTGGSLLFGTTGRTDLLGTGHARELAAHQHASAHKLATLLPDEALVWPTHGFGSFCSAGPPSESDASTIGREKGTNPALRLPVDAFADQSLAGLNAYPAYYAHMGDRNAAGADLIDLTPVTQADPAELALRIAAGEWVVDLRTRKAYAYQHLAGTLSFGLDGSLATWLGWTLPHGTPLTLLGESLQQVADARRELARIGIDRPAASATGAPQDWSRTPQDLVPGRSATFRDLVTASPEVVLDVRADHEWRSGHLPDAIHIPLPQLLVRLGEVPPGTVWVHCAAGYRAAAAASLLTRAGRDVVAIDDDWHPALAG
ncbi:hypothetical protein Ahu01nite_011380 [Winogradskya humida]|uniref:Rhodanese domain-containing protein n=1 Tax=Winogradskya humida TaxID=113566 RepID=A0ABQ3ZHI1_9ACTN|nr:hypothetical protein Ahu01nite_011380 [Actinoplanes humidus]